MNNMRRYFEEYLFKEVSEMKEDLRDLENVVAAMKKGDAELACKIALQPCEKIQYLHGKPRKGAHGNEG
jgi:DNA-binding GntR family transcriptional regulator